MSVTVFKLEVLGSRAARVLSAIADGTTTEFKVQQAVERALDELVGPPIENDVALRAAVDDEAICSVCSQPSSLCMCATNTP